MLCIFRVQDFDMNIWSMLVNKRLLCFFAYTLEALEAMGKADVEHFWLCVRACQLKYFRDLAVVLVRRSRAKTCGQQNSNGRL